MPAFDRRDDSQRPPSGPPHGNGKPPPNPTAKPHHNGCADVKPRLTKEQHDVLESHFQQQRKPSTAVKKGFADALNVPLDKINNWFQNRRAKVKQDDKKRLNQYNMSMYPTYSSHPEQLQQPPQAQDFYVVNADISPTCLPVQSVEGPSALELGAQMPLQQSFDMHHSLHSISEGARTSYHPNAVMQSIIAATKDAAYLPSNSGSLPLQDAGFAYDTTGLPTYSSDLSFSMPSTLSQDGTSANDVFGGYHDLGNLDYCSLTTMNTSNSADVQNSAGSLSSEPSPFSGTQSSGTTQSSSGPNASSVTSITSMYSGWTEEPCGPDTAIANKCEDPFEASYSMSQASASDHTMAYWAPNGHGLPFAQAGMYQHSNASAQAVLASPGLSEARKPSIGLSETENLPTYGDEVYARRNSSTSNLATNIEAIHIQNTTPDGFKQPNQFSSIAARRHKQPKALLANTMRSASYTSGMPSPSGPTEHTLRRIRSSGIPSAAGRIQKTTPSSAQRSPMTLNFTDAAASPKFARNFSTSSGVTVGQGGSLAPPTPLTPNEMGRFPAWQSNTVIRNHPAMPEHNSPESLYYTTGSVEPQSAGLVSSAASPPSTPLDLGQFNQARLGADNVYRDTPPQSAPATQQSFPRTAFMHPPQMGVGYHSTSDLTIAQPKPSHFRRPSLPDAGHAQLDESSMQYPVQFGNWGGYDNFKDISLDGITHNVPFAPPVSAMPDFLVHEYNPPHDTGPHTAILRRTNEPQPKNYVFANQGPKDFLRS
ncbi:hypothetical protein BDV95DRAFT_497274 [Massariosphaeria phaeospora]|uniref:Homeobox domain-containing protein n=1 Tax=Massariosphaeria phaeospora TaxID=100035 RepID=A0A7C8I5T9_9PLEO|nr:hypothetical protein BDV95DRAFT_497274 [Massariosphaeria phaeospora]